VVQVLSFLTSPILSRLFLPVAFGIAQNFNSIVTTLGVISAMRYEVTIMLPKRREDAANQLSISLMFTALTGLLMAPLLWMWREPIAGWLRSPELAPYFWLVPVGVVAESLFAVLRQWNSRNRKYLRLSAVQVSDEATADALKLGLGFGGQTGGGALLVSNLVGSVVSTGLLGGLIWRDDGKFILKSIRWQKMREGIWQYRKFPLYNIWAAFLNTASLNIPAFLLSAFFSPTVTGYYSLGNRLLRLPISLISGSIGQVFYQRAARAYHDGNLDRLVDETFHRLVVFGLFPMLLITVIGKELFVVLFGPEWTQAGVYSQILSLWTFFVFLAAPLSGITNVLGRNEVSLILNLVVFITRALSLVIGGILNNVILGLVLFSASGVLSYGAYCLWATSVSGVPLQRTLRQLGSNLLFCAPFLGVTALVKWLVPLPETSLTALHLSLPGLVILAVGGLAGVAYYLLAIVKDQMVRDALVPILRKYHLWR